MLFLEAVKIIAEENICDTADDGHEGLLFLDSARVLPDLVFLDINMPRVDGRQTLRAIRSNARLSALNVVIYSTSCSSLDMRWAREMNATYLTKPTDFPNLVRALTPRLQQLAPAEVCR